MPTLWHDAAVESRYPAQIAVRSLAVALHDQGGMRRTNRLSAVLTLLFTSAPHIAAQKTIISSGEMETATATIRKLDVSNRFVMLRGNDGEDIGMFAPPEFKRFDELRVGDRVTIAYYQSTVYRLTLSNAPASAVSEEGRAVESGSTLPGATFSHQTTERVTVKAIDRKAALITVAGADGRRISRHVHNPSDLDGVETGDRIDVIYTIALLASVTRTN